MRRAVITGLGTVNPLANNVADFWKAVCRGDSGVETISQFDAGAFRTRIGAEVKDFHPEQLFGGKQARRLDRYAQFSLAAAQEAVADAGLEIASVAPGRIGTVVGTGTGGIGVIGDECSRFEKVGPSRTNPFLVPRMMPNAGAASISIHYGLQGPCLSISSACASATDAIAFARDLILAGRADVVITGGSEAALTPIGLAGFCAARSLSERNDDPHGASRPFDRDRDGFVLGEGAGILILEEESFARRRGANVYCVLAGCGQTADAHHITAPDPEGAGAAEAIRLALLDADTPPCEIDYLNAHATGTAVGDAAEAKAIRQAFGSHAESMPISCTKSMIGHLCGASGGVAAIVLAMTIREGIIHPTLNADHPDADVPFDLVPGSARKQTVRNAALNSFGFGGHNSTLVFKAA